MESEIIDTTKMSTRGQVIIPREIRDFIGADRDTIFTVMPIDKETIIMKKIDKSKLLEEFKKIRTETKKLQKEEIDNEIRENRKAKGGN